MIRMNKQRANEELERIKSIFLYDFFNEKSEKKKESLTLPQARISHPRLFKLPSKISFKNPELIKVAKLKPQGASDCFEITKKSEGIKAPLKMPQLARNETQLAIMLRVEHLIAEKSLKYQQHRLSIATEKLKNIQQIKL